MALANVKPSCHQISAVRSLSKETQERVTGRGQATPHPFPGDLFGEKQSVGKGLRETCQMEQMTSQDPIEDSEYRIGRLGIFLVGRGVVDKL